MGTQQATQREIPCFTGGGKGFLMSREGASLPLEEFAESHHKIPALIVGGTRCGKSNCRCATTEHRHRTACLYWRDAYGQSHRRYVPKDEVDAVRAIIERRQAERQAWRRSLAEAKIELRLLRQFGKAYGLW